MWDIPQLKHTWILDNTETAIGVTIRQLVDMRDAELPQDAARQDIKVIRTLMTEMKLESKGSGLSPPPMPAPLQQQQQRQQVHIGMAPPPYIGTNMANMEMHRGMQQHQPHQQQQHQHW